MEGYIAGHLEVENVNHICQTQYIDRCEKEHYIFLLNMKKPEYYVEK